MATETKEKRKGAEEQVQVKWYGYIALLVGILFFSGLFQKAPGALKALDFNNVMGSFGTLGELTKGSGTLAENFRGVGGSGPKDGWLYALTLLPSVMFALGMVKIIEHLDGMKAAQKLLSPLLKPLMGLPGSYIIATPNSYVGSLVELAGGENVYSDTDQEFLTVNTEDMKTKEPDIILRAAHALPDQVVEMFNKDFAENDIWQHFDAVKNGRVYDLTYEYFGMSATFKYPQALEELQPILYPASDEDTQKAKEASDNAQKKAKDSDATEKYNEQQKESK